MSCYRYTFNSLKCGFYPLFARRIKLLKLIQCTKHNNTFCYLQAHTAYYNAQSLWYVLSMLLSYLAPVMLPSLLFLKTRGLNHPSTRLSSWKEATSAKADTLIVQYTNFQASAAPKCQHKDFPYVFFANFYR